MTLTRWFHRHQSGSAHPTEARSPQRARRAPRYVGQWEDRDAARGGSDILAARSRSSWE